MIDLTRESRPYQIDVVWEAEPVLRPYRFDAVRRPVFQVAERMLYGVTLGGVQREILIEPGFLTDGASIPLGLRWLIPQIQATWAPALLHDKAYGARGWNEYTRAQCDALFGVALTKQAIPARRIMAMYCAVSMFGRASWDTDGPLDHHNRAHGFLSSSLS